MDWGVVRIYSRNRYQPVCAQPRNLQRASNSAYCETRPRRQRLVLDAPTVRLTGSGAVVAHILGPRRVDGTAAKSSIRPGLKPMRVAFVCYEAFARGGIRTYTRELLPRISAMGHEVTLFCPDHSRPDLAALSAGIRLALVDSMDFVFLRAPSFWWNLSHSIRAVERETGRFDLVHSNNVADFLMPKGAVDPPRIVTAFHLGLSTLHAGQMRLLSGLAHPSSEYGAAILAQSVCLRRANHIIAISQFTQQEILTRYPSITEDAISVVYPGVSLRTRIQDPVVLDVTRRRFGLHPNRPIILFAGRLEKRKGLDNLLQAFREIRKRRQASLVIVGDGNLESWKRRSSKLGVSQSVVFTGYVNQDTYLALCSMA